MDLTGVNSNPGFASAAFAAPAPTNIEGSYATQASEPPTLSPFEQQMQDALQRSSVGPAVARAANSLNAVAAEAKDPEPAAESPEPAVTTPQNWNNSAALPSKTRIGVNSPLTSATSKNESASGQGMNPPLIGAVGTLSNLAPTTPVPSPLTSQPVTAAPPDTQADITATTRANANAGLGSTEKNCSSSIPMITVDAGVPSNAVLPSLSDSSASGDAFGATALSQTAVMSATVSAVSNGAGNQNVGINESTSPDTRAPSATNASPVIGEISGLPALSSVTSAAPTTDASVDPMPVLPNGSQSANAAGRRRAPADSAIVQNSDTNDPSTSTASVTDTVTDASAPPQNKATTATSTNSVDTHGDKSAGNRSGIALPPALTEGGARSLGEAISVPPTASPAVNPSLGHATTRGSQPDPAAASSLIPGTDGSSAPPSAASPRLILPMPSNTGGKPDEAQVRSTQSAEGGAVDQGGTLQPDIKSAFAKGTSSPVGVGVAKPNLATRNAGSSFALRQMEQPQSGKEPASAELSTSSNSQEITPPDPKAPTRAGVPDSSNTPSGTANANPFPAIPADALFAHTLTQLTPAAVLHQDAVVDAASAQAQTLSVPVSAPHATATPSAPPASPSSSPNGSPSTSAPLPDPDGSPIHFVGNAKLVQTASHSEMRIAMDSDKLGPVELRARVVGDEIGAAITVEKRDAHAALSVELPALQQALSEKQLRVDQVTLVHGSLHSTSGDAGAAARQQQDQRQASGALAPPWSIATPNSHFVGQGFLYGSDTAMIFDSQGRLSVHA
jgi:hypothetical protein